MPSLTRTVRLPSLTLSWLCSPPSIESFLGSPVYTVSGHGQCPACGLHSEKEGDNAISCGSDEERIPRHNHLRDTFYHTAVSAAPCYHLFHKIKHNMTTFGIKYHLNIQQAIFNSFSSAVGSVTGMRRGCTSNHHLFLVWGGRES